jgi:hypothetical protein
MKDWRELPDILGLARDCRQKYPKSVEKVLGQEVPV